MISLWDDEPRHHWHTHISFRRWNLGHRELANLARLSARVSRGNHRQVKRHRDLMRYHAKMDARS